MYNSDLYETILTEEFEEYYKKLSYMTELRDIKMIVINDNEFIKKFEEETEKFEEKIEKVEIAGNFKDILKEMIKDIIKDDKEYIKARRKTNNSYMEIIEMLEKCSK